MGQKVNPHGLRVGVIKDWNSRWYADADFADNLIEDHKIRTYLKKRLYSAGVSKIEIERASDRVKVIVYTAKPGVVIGRQGSEIEKVKAELKQFTNKKLLIDIKEVKMPECDAQLVAENIAAQLEKRISFRRAMKLGFYEGVNLSLAYCDDCGHQELEMDVCPKCGSRNLTKIDRMNGYLSYSRVHGESRLNDAKMAEIAERKSM